MIPSVNLYTSIIPSATRFARRLPLQHSITYKIVNTQTSDNYVLTFHHLPPSKPSLGTVLFIHGMFESGAMAFTHSTESLPVILQERGYDVFLANGRGNMYGLKHTKMSSWDPKFWDFDMKTHAKLDFPAMVTAALSSSTAKQSAIIVYGTSQGSLVALMGLALNPSLNKKVKLVCAISPALVLRTPTNPLVSMVFKMEPSILGSPQYFMFASFTQCFVPDWLANVVAFAALKASGMSQLTMDKDGAWDVMASTPSGFLPTKSMRMYQKILKDGPAFFKDKDGECDFGKIDTNIALWMGKEDVVLDVDATTALLEGLDKAKIVKKVVLDGWGHTDLWYSIESKTVLTPDVIKLIETMG